MPRQPKPVAKITPSKPKGKPSSPAARTSPKSSPDPLAFLPSKLRGLLARYCLLMEISDPRDAVRLILERNLLALDPAPDWRLEPDEMLDAAPDSAD